MKKSDQIIEVKLIEDRILASEWPNHAIVSKESMDDETSQRQALTNEPHALLVKLHGIKSITDNAWEIISGDYFHSITTALAILYDQSSGFYEHGKIMVDLRFVHSIKVEYPVRFFDDEESALRWLRSFNKSK
jgi:hypothetical protein